jgi:hypothetical protein
LRIYIAVFVEYTGSLRKLFGQLLWSQSVPHTDRLSSVSALVKAMCAGQSHLN